MARFYKNKKICQRIWIFFIHKISIWATKTGLDTAKTASKKVVHKTAEATAALIENKIAEGCETKTCT